MGCYSLEVATHSRNQRVKCSRSHWFVLCGFGYNIFYVSLIQIDVKLGSVLWRVVKVLNKLRLNLIHVGVIDCGRRLLELKLRLGSFILNSGFGAEGCRHLSLKEGLDSSPERYVIQQ